jgi:hypothetical protein
MIRTRTALALAGIAGVVAPVAMAASPAAAWTSTCHAGNYSGDSCIFYTQTFGGAHGGDFYPNYYYPNNGTGQGTHVWNNNGSNRNMDGVCKVTIWYHKDYQGPSKTLQPYNVLGYQLAGTGLGSLLNNIRSQSWAC